MNSIEARRSKSVATPRPNRQTVCSGFSRSFFFFSSFQRETIERIEINKTMQCAPWYKHTDESNGDRMKHDFDANRFSKHAAPHTYIHKQAFGNEYTSKLCTMITWCALYGLWNSMKNGIKTTTTTTSTAAAAKNKAAVLYAFTHDERVWRYFTRMQLTLCTCLLVYVLTVAHQRANQKIGWTKNQI